MAERRERQASDTSWRGSTWLPKAMPASIRDAGPVIGAAYTLIGAIILLGLVGYFADKWLGTDPWLLIAGLLLGIVVGFYELAKVVWRRTR
jgi:ATP synthase protein I